MNDLINARCGWAGTDELYVKYHDEEWGKPVDDDRILFEFLVLESAQAGLSWITILRKREGLPPFRPGAGGADDAGRGRPADAIRRNRPQPIENHHYNQQCQAIQGNSERVRQLL